MNPKTRNWLLIAIGIWLIYFAVKALGILAYYRLSTSSMEPNYPTGKFIIASNLVSPERSDVVCYHATQLPIEGIREAQAGQFIGRIVAIGDDKMELKDGYVFINNENTEEELPLKFMYKISQQARAENAALISALNLENELKLQTGESYLMLDQQEKQAYAGHEAFVLFDPAIREDFDFPARSLVEDHWTLNNYGPLDIPPGHFFILGDNRHNSEDSRMRGFVPEEDVTGVVIN